MFDRPFLIAVTGGIASGKSLLADWFERQGFAVHDCDRIAHQILNEPDIIKQIKAVFGTQMISDNAVDRRKLSALVFADADKLEKLNKIIHPRVYQKMRDLIIFSKADCLVFEVPLLFENNLQAAFDLTINVFADKKVQIERIMARDQLGREEAERRIEAQMPDFDKQKLADVNIANNGTPQELFRTMQNLLPLIRKLKKKEVKDLLRL